MPEMIWAGASLAASGVFAPLLAQASLRLPGGDGNNLKRSAAVGGGMIALAIWAWLVHPGPMAFVGALFGGWLLLIAIIDAEHFWLPDILTLPLGITGLIVAAVMAPAVLADRAIGVIIGFCVLAGLAALYERLRGRRGLGGGDARMLAAVGAWVGWQGLPSVLLIGSVAGLVVVLVMAVRGQKPRADVRLPFGTFMALGAWVTWLYGPIGL